MLPLVEVHLKTACLENTLITCDKTLKKDSSSISIFRNLSKRSNQNGTKRFVFMDLHHKIIYENKMLKVAMVNNQ